METALPPLGGGGGDVGGGGKRARRRRGTLTLPPVVRFLSELNGSGAALGAMGRYSGQTCRLIFMLVITAVFFVAEIVAGYLGNSLALVSDSFNMLSDILSLCVGLASGRLSRRPASPQCTFGLARAEVVGALANAAFLAALCFSVSAEAVKRLARPEAVDEPFIVLVVGSLGLAVNIVGLLVFQDCRWLCRKKKKEEEEEEQRHDKCADSDGKIVMNGEAGFEMAASGHQDKKQSEGPPLNIRGVLLHVLNDALGSVVVVVASALFYVRPLPSDAPCNWQCYVDPSLTLVMVAIIVASGVPLVKETSRILLQMSPPDLDVTTILEEVCQLPGVLGIHEVHVWELAKDRNVASLHVKVTSDLESSKSEIRRLHKQIREVFHRLGVHSVTLQMEFVDEEMENSHCVAPCISYDCLKDSCCPTDRKTHNHTDLHKVNVSRTCREIATDSPRGRREDEENRLESTPF
ncbi:zinc transporter 10 [Silurus asotus]|uniref:Zinc transporter 10 n=1 Tax=Silurus asotus TaxID=30991 RepID=A0AAD5A7Y7_SILAS|nr:zinc transporter 10 [Silurus asotus]